LSISHRSFCLQKHKSTSNYFTSCVKGWSGHLIYCGSHPLPAFLPPLDFCKSLVLTRIYNKINLINFVWDGSRDLISETIFPINNYFIQNLLLYINCFFLFLGVSFCTLFSLSVFSVARFISTLVRLPIQPKYRRTM